MISPKNIENPKRKSGYNYVSQASGPGRALTWRATKWNGKVPGGWYGPARATALEAAWDYCNHVNGLTVAPTQQLKVAGHPSAPRKAPTARQQRQAVAKKAKESKGFVYLLGEEGDDRYVKIGESGKHPRYRLAKLQTGNPRKLIVLGYIECADRFTVERNLHMKHIKRNHLQEWFMKDPKILQEFPQTQSGEDV